MDHVLVILLVVGDTALLSLRLGAWMKRAMDPAPGQADRLTGLSARIAGISGVQDRKRHPITRLILELIMFTGTFDPAHLAMVAAQFGRQGRARPHAGFNAAAPFTTKPTCSIVRARSR